MSREAILKYMDELNSTGINCHKCSAPCCTFAHNSMKISESEAMDLYRYYRGLSVEEQEKIRKDAQACIQRFRLDQPALTIHKNATMRRYYTCPFFEEEKRICQLPAEVKPMGCLTFNPKSAHQTQGGDCSPITKFMPKKTDDEWLPIPVYLMKLIDIHDRN